MQSVETSGQFINKQFSINEESSIAAVVQVDSINISANKLEALLKEYRLKKAKQSGMKAFHIFMNKKSDELFEMRPVTIDELRKIRGMGKKKIEDFGKELLETIRGFRLR